MRCQQGSKLISLATRAPSSCFASYPLFAATAALCVFTACSGCGASAPTHEHAPEHGKTFVYEGDYPIKIVCTTGQVADALSAIGGSHVEVTGLMGPGIDPHVFVASPSDIASLHEADLVVYNGLHLEGRLTDTFAQMASRRATFAVTDGLLADHDERLRSPPEFEGQHDPHVWHDVSLWIDCVRYATDRLKSFDARHSEDYDNNAQSYIAALSELDGHCRQRIEEIPAAARVLVTAHDAFGYFAQAYGLEVHGIKGISTDDEVDIGRMEELAALLKERGIPAIFVESSTPPSTVDALIERAATLGHQVLRGRELYADALGEPDGDAANYIGMIKTNVDTIVSGLSR